MGKMTREQVHNERARCPHNVRRKEGGRRREENGEWRVEKERERRRMKELEGESKVKKAGEHP